MVESIYPIALAAALAGVLTYCDLAAVFDPPPRGLPWQPRLRLAAWWWAFILANAVLAVLLFQALRGREPFKDWDQYLAAAAVGAGYTALVRLKFATLPSRIGNVRLHFTLLRNKQLRVRRTSLRMGLVRGGGTYAVG